MIPHALGFVLRSLHQLLNITKSPCRIKTNNFISVEEKGLSGKPFRGHIWIMLSLLYIHEFPLTTWKSSSTGLSSVLEFMNEFVKIFYDIYLQSADTLIQCGHRHESFFVKKPHVHFDSLLYFFVDLFSVNCRRMIRCLHVFLLYNFKALSDYEVSAKMGRTIRIKKMPVP